MKRIVWPLFYFLFMVNLVFSAQTQHKPHEDVHNNDAGICLITHEPASKDYVYTYKDKTYYFCCPACIEEFKKDPERYISKIKEIKLEAYQYGFSPDPVVVKKGDVVRLIATSRDVPHGVYIKEFRVNLMAEKGKINATEFFAHKSGEFDIICSLYCGPQHSKMKGKLIVED